MDRHRFDADPDSDPDPDPDPTPSLTYLGKFEKNRLLFIAAPINIVLSFNKSVIGVNYFQYFGQCIEIFKKITPDLDSQHCNLQVTVPPQSTEMK